MTTMSTVVVLQARMGSRRLPGKVMRRLAGRPLVEHCLQRLIASDVGPVVLATTATSADDVLVEVGAAVGVEVVCGPEHDVLGRFARVVDRYPVRVVIRATADNPAVDVESPRRVLSIAERQSADYVVEDDLPCGAAVEAVRVDALLDAYVSTQGLDDREHVTTYVKRMTDRFRVVRASAPEAVRRPDLRLTVDTEGDLAFMRHVLDTAGAREGVVPLPVIIGAADRVMAEAGVA